MSVTRQKEDLLTRIRDLERQVRELRRGSLYNAAISQGGLEVRTPEGAVILRAGELVIGSEIVYGVEMRRTNGSVQARFFDTAAGGGGYWAMFDEAGNIIVSDDTVSGEGLATPYIPMTAMPYSQILNPPLSTVSPTFEILYRAHCEKQQPKARFWIAVDTDADTTGEIIVADAGVQVSSTLEIPVSSNHYYWIDADVSGDLRSFVRLDLQARRTAGTGSVRVAVAWCSGRQS